VISSDSPSVAAGRIEGSARHQRLAAAGRPHHAYIVVARTGDLKRALGVFLAANLLEIYEKKGRRTASVLLSYLTTNPLG